MNYRAPQRPPVGIDDMALYVPRHYLPIVDLAEARGIEPDKLRLGLGLEAMSLPDTFEDAATLAANAVYELIERSGLRPQAIGRLYLGTESALDGAKPTATYVLESLRNVYKAEHGADCLDHCDVVDLTFACIGAVDALLTTVDWVKAGEGRVGIVVASDVAKYELGSTGEYTQGAGAVALLVREHPRLLALLPDVGVCSRGVHDFFKPVRQVRRVDMVTEVLELLEAQRPQVLAKADLADGGRLLDAHGDDFAQTGVLDANDESIGVHTMTPTFDGPYSNAQYQARVRSAYDHYVRLSETPPDQQPLFGWERVVVHLPYAAHGRRMLVELFVLELLRQGVWDDLAASAKLRPAPTETSGEAWDAYLRTVGKSSLYKSYVEQQLAGTADASALVGNLYTGSIFLALMSTLARAAEQESGLVGKTFGFMAYGSGSKSKVFAGVVRAEWRAVVDRWRLFAQLGARTPIDYERYERLHRGRLVEPLAEPSGVFALDRIETEGNKRGARYYRFAERRED